MNFEHVGRYLVQIWVFTVRAFADKFSVGKTQIVDIITNKDALYKTWGLKQTKVTGFFNKC